MSKFKAAFSISIALWFLFNIGCYFTGPPERVGVSGRRHLGFPFPVRIENIAYTASGPVVSPIRNAPWIAPANFVLWCLLSYRFARWVDRKGSGWWLGKRSGRQNTDQELGP
jgi:hypothetical protein